MQMNNYLFTITIASIHTYISQARKLKDLYAGSEIVSSLIKNIIKDIETMENSEIILPQDKNIVSNKIVFKLSQTTEDEVKKFGEEIEKKFKEYINVFSVFWVAMLFENNKYKETYKKLEKNLSLIKNTRIFFQSIEESMEDEINGKKCSLCGIRNIEKSSIDKLCKVCLEKRKKYLNDEKIPSLAKICLADWLANINYSELRKEKDFDEEWFLVENKKSCINNFIKDNKLDISKKKKHYALVHLDIDSLGEKLNSVEQDKQKELSKKLSEFAKLIKEKVNKKNEKNYENGKTIYAGGDDFLAVINLAKLFDIIEIIYDEFKSISNNDLTFSTSIIIAYYKTPLHKVLEYSRELLKESKEFYEDKNAMGLMVINGSAITSKSIFKYEDFILLKKLKAHDIASNLYFKLKNIFSYLEKMNYDDFLIQKEMIKIELRRQIKRESNFDKTNSELVKLVDSLCEFLDKQSKELSTNMYKIDFDNFIGYLKSLEQLNKVIK